MSALAQIVETASPEAVEAPELTDGFHLVVESLKLNDITTI